VFRLKHRAIGRPLLTSISLISEAKLDCNTKRFPPYKDLYVYLLDGPVPSRFEAGLGAAFIGNWVEGKQSFLFFSSPSRDEVKQLLVEMPSLVVMDEFQFTYDEWQGGGLAPTRIGPFLIHPPWLSVDPNFDEVRIVLDPGVVFGNGLHPTTRDCLLALSHVFEREPDVNSVIDLGTGTGILALASAKLGASRVTAVDLNPLCVKTALLNVRLNGLEGKVRVHEGKVEDHIGGETDLIAANLHFGLIETVLRMGGFRNVNWLIISGLLRTQWREVRHALVMNGYQIEKEWDHEMTWFTILALRQRVVLNGSNRRCDPVDRIKE
jgi:ribosomal protein L11 methyltransferase